MRVIHPDDSETGGVRREVSGVVAALLALVPAAAVHLDDHAPLHHEIHASDSRYPHLRRAREPGLDERHTDE